MCVCLYVCWIDDARIYQNDSDGTVFHLTDIFEKNERKIGTAAL